MIANLLRCRSVIGVERRPGAAEGVRVFVGSAGERPVASGLLMRHLPQDRRQREVFGQDAAERVQNLLAGFGGQGQPQLARVAWAFEPELARGGQERVERDACGFSLLIALPAHVIPVR